MFFLLSKLLDFLLQPVLWILVLLLVGVWRYPTSSGRKATTAALLLLIFLTNPFLSNQAWLLWETPPVPIEQVGFHDAAIILTGITKDEKSPNDRVYTNKGADRILHPLALYRKGKVGKFIISGGSGSLRTAANSEAADLRGILLDAGVPDSLILLEAQSRNTRENARFTARLLRNHPELNNLLLVTSAFHMPRAEGCFRKAGVAVTPFPADYYGMDQQYTPTHLLLPTESSLKSWQQLLHEWAGYITYKILGYT